MQDTTPPITDSAGVAHDYVFCLSEIEAFVNAWQKDNPHLELVQVHTASFIRGHDWPCDVHMVGLQFRLASG